MERWGSSYLLHDVTPTKLVAGLGASTDGSGHGTLRVSFAKDCEILAMKEGTHINELAIKWDLAIQLVALIQILVVQNQLLRAEKPGLPAASDAPSPFEARGDVRSGIVCSWPAAVDGIVYNPTPDPDAPGQVELLLSEPVAVRLMASLVETIARRGVRG